MGARKGHVHSEETRRKIGDANRGKTKVRKYEIECIYCGGKFMAPWPSCKYCSKRCNRMAIGQSRVYSKEWAHFAKLCSICGVTEDLVGDHDHENGEPRGVLCRTCNIAIGYMKDSPERLESAARYLREAVHNDQLEG